MSEATTRDNDSESKATVAGPLSGGTNGHESGSAAPMPIAAALRPLDGPYAVDVYGATPMPGELSSGDVAEDDAHAAMHLRAESLARVELFEGLTLEDLEVISENLKFVRVRKGEIICTEGEPSDAMYVIETGQVKVVSDVATERIVLAYLGPGSHFGEMSLLTSEPRSAGVIVSIDAELLKLDKEDFDALLRDHPAIAVTMSRVLAQRLRQTDTQVFERKKYQIVGICGDDGVELAQTITEQVGCPVIILDVLADCSVTPGTATDMSSVRDNVRMLGENVGLFPIALDVCNGQFSEVVSRLLESGFEYALVRLPGAGRDARQLALEIADAVIGVGSDGDWLAQVERHKLWQIHAMTPRNRGRLARRVTRRSVGLALSSGAGHGLAHVGVIKVLEEQGVPIDMVAGTSMGALVGGLLVAGMARDGSGRVGYNAAELRWWAGEMARRGKLRSGWRDSYWDVNLPFLRTGFLRGNTTLRWVRELTHDARFEDLDTPFYVVAAEVNQGREVIINKGSIAEAVRASTAIPGLFSAYKLNGEYLTDGGAVNPVPCSSLAEAGADIIIASNTVPPLEERSHRRARKGNRTPSAVSVLLSVREVSEALVAKLKTQPFDVLITPQLGMWSSFEVEHYKEFIAAGEEAAQEAVEKIRQMVKV